LHAQTATIENGFVHLPNAAHWLADYVHEMTSFPKGKHDDQVDPTAQALARIKQSTLSSAEAWIEYYRGEVEEAHGKKQSVLVRLKAPAGVGSVHLLSGPTMAVPPGGILELTEKNALPLLRAGWGKMA
jgi:hypothetical protein